MRELSQGENCAIPSTVITVTVACASPVDVSALLLNGSRRVRSDADLVFYNNPAGPGATFLGQVSGAVTAIQVDTEVVPEDVQTVVITASLDGPGTFAQAGTTVVTVHDAGGADAIRFQVPGLSTETALVCAEVYRRSGYGRCAPSGRATTTVWLGSPPTSASTSPRTSRYRRSPHPAHLHQSLEARP